jgi:hypothetical protein
MIATTNKESESNKEPATTGCIISHCLFLNCYIHFIFEPILMDQTVNDGLSCMKRSVAMY